MKIFQPKMMFVFFCVLQKCTKVFKKTTFFEQKTPKIGRNSRILSTVAPFALEKPHFSEKKRKRRIFRGRGGFSIFRSWKNGGNASLMRISLFFGHFLAILKNPKQVSAFFCSKKSLFDFWVWPLPPKTLLFLAKNPTFLLIYNFSYFNSFKNSYLVETDTVIPTSNNLLQTSPTIIPTPQLSYTN